VTILGDFIFVLSQQFNTSIDYIFAQCRA